MAKRGGDGAAYRMAGDKSGVDLKRLHEGRRILGRIQPHTVPGELVQAQGVPHLCRSRGVWGETRRWLFEIVHCLVDHAHLV